jgi:hypothetical protein
MKRLIYVMALAVLLPWCAKADPVVVMPDASSPQWDIGGDLRLRWVGQNNMPTETHGETHGTDFFRIRTRLWGKVTTEKLEGYLRVTNEFRYYRSPRSSKGKQRFPDVTLIDNLYVTFKDVGDLVDIKIGRQDMDFGKRRMIGEGTPIDGSRTAYFDALRLTFKFDNKRTLDAFALYIAREDWMPTLGKRHDARPTGRKGYHEDITAYNQNEYGAGLYYQDRSSAALGWDLYYIFKGEEGSKSRVLTTGPFHSHTVGTRLLPKFTETLSGETEIAVQVGDDNLFAAQVYAGLTYAPKWEMDPRFTIAALYLSGDREGQRGTHAWHSLFNRETALGDLIGAMYDANDHCNLFYPHLSVGLTPADGHTFFMTTGPLFAPVAESDPAGGTYSKYRGYYLQARYVIEIGQYLAEDTIFEKMQFRVLGEVMTKDDYFDDDADNIGYYAEVQLVCAF